MRTVKFIIALVAVSCSLNAFGQKNEKEKVVVKEEVKIKGHHGKHDGQGKMNLSEDQQKKIKEIRLKTAREIMPLRNQLAEKKARLHTISTVDKPDMNEINKTIDEMAALKAQIEKKRVASRMEVRSLLNDEQRLMFDMKGEKAMKKYKMKRKEHEHHGKHKGKEYYDQD
jgi:Spy/CpxP family protein refolding chaperone